MGKRYSKIDKTCLNCGNCTPIGDGDHICLECGDKPIIVLDNYNATDDFYKCNGKHWEEA
jgi:hypothetical protein